MKHDIKRLLQVLTASKNRLEEIEYWANNGNIDAIKEYFKYGSGSGQATLEVIKSVTSDISNRLENMVIKADISGDENGNMNDKEIDKYAKLFISMSTNCLMGQITKDHFINTMNLAIKKVMKDSRFSL